ncbi:uncharacterized protein [Narcine bancroftii]|uniref:uncharacterized protein n=1 Tax=Narcine bancroftii TaxID=1343680 RepID=UPI0038317806
MNLPPILDGWIGILILCLSQIAMNSSPNRQRPEDGHPPNHNRFFFQPMPAPHMFMSPLSHFMPPAAFPPYFYPTVEFGGSLYYPVCPMPLPRSYGPQSPMAHTNFRRPYFNSFVTRPTFYPTRFKHYPFRRNVTNTEVQTDTSETNPVQPKRADVVNETITCSRQTAEMRHQSPSATESSPDSTGILLQERVAQKVLQVASNETEETSGPLTSKSSKASGYALQKEKIRINCSEGAPSINVWRSFEATVPIYNTPHKKVEDGIQCEVWSVSACESGVPFYGPFEADKITQKAEVPNTSQGVPLDSNTSPETGFESRTEEDLSCPPMHGKEDKVSCKINKSGKFLTSEFVQEASEKLSVQESPSGPFQQNEMEEQDATNEQSEIIISAEPLNETKMGEMLKSDASLESAEEYIPSASVLAWLQDQAQSNWWKPGTPQPLQHQPRILDGSFEETSSKDEESSLDFFDTMHGKTNVSYSHLMCNPHSSPRCPAISETSDQISSKTFRNRIISEREQFCSSCRKELLKVKGMKHVCRKDSATWSVGSDALLEREDLRKDQLIQGTSSSSGQRRCRRISRESSRSNRNKKTHYSSDSFEEDKQVECLRHSLSACVAIFGSTDLHQRCFCIAKVSEEQDESWARIPEKAKVDGFSRKKIIRRSPKIATLQISRLQQEKLRAKKRAHMAKYIPNEREQIKVGHEYQEFPKSGQISKPELKHTEGKRCKCTQKTRSVQNASEDSVDEYWNKVGAKPKSATQSLDDAEYEKVQQVESSGKLIPQKKKASQELDEMDFWDLSDVHGFQGNSLRRGRTKSAKKMHF